MEMGWRDFKVQLISTTSQLEQPLTTYAFGQGALYHSYIWLFLTHFAVFASCLSIQFSDASGMCFPVLSILVKRNCVEHVTQPVAFCLET